MQPGTWQHAAAGLTGAAAGEPKALLGLAGAAPPAGQATIAAGSQATACASQCEPPSAALEAWGAAEALLPELTSCTG